MVRNPKRSVLVARGLPGWLAWANRLLIGLGRIGVAAGPVRVLTIPGRVSGEPRSTPVTPVSLDGQLFVIAALPQADWARNARAAGRGTLTRGRREEDVGLVEVHDQTRRRDVLRAFPAQAPGGVSFFVRLELVDRADPEQFAAAADRVAVFEILAANDR